MEYLLWILLIFTAPDDASGGGTVRVLRTYTQYGYCQEDEDRARIIGLPPGAMVTCISMKQPIIV